MSDLRPIRQRLEQLDLCGLAFRPLLALAAARVGIAGAAVFPLWFPDGLRPSELPAIQHEMARLVPTALGEIARAGIDDPNLSEIGRQAKRRETAAGWLRRVEQIGRRIEPERKIADDLERDMRRDLEQRRGAIAGLELARAQVAAATIDASNAQQLLEAIEQGNRDAILAGLVVAGYGPLARVRAAAERHFEAAELGETRVLIVRARAAMRDTVALHYESIVEGLRTVAAEGELPRRLSGLELIERGVRPDGDLARRVKELGLHDVGPNEFAVDPNNPRSPNLDRDAPSRKSTTSPALDAAFARHGVKAQQQPKFVRLAGEPLADEAAAETDSLDDERGGGAA